MPISPLGGITCKILLQILEASTRFPICVPLQLFVYLLPFKIYSTRQFWLGFAYTGANLGDLGARRPQNLNCGDSCQTVSDHHILQDVISYATAWRSCTVCISMVDISLVAVVATSRGDT